MSSKKVVFWLFFIVCWCNGRASDQMQLNIRPENVLNKNSKENMKSTYSLLSESISQVVKDDDSSESCVSDDTSCLSTGINDNLGLEAITALHRQLDDDENGNVDLSETNDFLREELQYDSGYEKRQKAFHRNDDTHISVKELWEAWLRSEVHNWTVEQTTEWLAICVELPQYAHTFLRNKVTGAMLPRLAVNNVHLMNALGIKDPIHKQKIALKAMDVVLFGPPKDSQNHWKDLVLITLLIGGGIGLWYAVQQNKKFKTHLHRMNRDMESLQSAERALEDLQKELEMAKQAQEDVATEKLNLEKKLQEADSSGLHTSYSDLEVTQLKAEIEMLRRELQIAEGELKDRCWSSPPALQQWLQLTHELENKQYIKKKIAAEKQLQQAREACEKLRKKRSSLVGAFVSTHGKSIDDVDRSIVEARTSLNEVTQELQERVYRWKQIERLCGCNIIVNNGLQYLENTLYRNANGRPQFSLRGRMSSQDDLDDDTSSLYGYATGLHDSIGPHVWKEADSSGSEGSRQEDDIYNESRPPGHNSIHFLVGGEVANLYHEEPVVPVVHRHARVASQPTSIRSASNNNILISSKGSQMVRSQSQDINVALLENVTSNPKPAQSESALDHSIKCKVIAARPQLPMAKEQSPLTLEDDVCSTDSSVMDDEVKKRKRKIFGFSKKNKNKPE